MKKIKYLWMLILLAGIIPVSSQPVGLALPDTTGMAGELIDIPVVVQTDLTGLNVTAYQLQINFTASRLELQDVLATGTLTESLGSFSHNVPASGQVMISAAGSSPLSGKGNLILLRFRMLTNGTATLNFSNTQNNMLNEGSPAVTLVNGRVIISNPPVITVFPNDAILAPGETVNFSVSGGNDPFQWELSVPPVGTIDSISVRGARFTAVQSGRTRIIARDKDGITDSTNNFIEVRPLAVSLPDTVIFQGSSVLIPIRTTDLSGLDIKAGSIIISHSATILQATGIVTNNCLLAAYSNVTAKYDAGKVLIAFAGTTPLSGAGILCYVEMTSNLNYTGTSALNLAESTFNENILAKQYNGSCRVNGLPALSITPGTATIFTHDTLRFRVSSNNASGPLVWSTTDSLIASIDQAGLLTAQKSGAINVLVRDSIGAKGSSGVIQIYDTRVTIPDTSEMVSSLIDVPVYVEEIRSGEPVFSVQGVFSYDTTQLEIQNVLTEGTIGAGWAHAIRVEGNRIIFAGAGTSGATAAGKIAVLRFLVRASARIGQRANISIQELMLNEGKPRAVLENGSVLILTPVAPGTPVLLNPANGSQFVPINTVFRWTRSTGTQNYHLQIADNPDFTAPVVNDSTISDTVKTIAALPEDVTFYWRIRARNISGDSEWTAAWSFQTLVNAIGEEDPNNIPERFQLEQNYPNPFNPETTIRFALPEAADVRLEIFNTAGERVDELIRSRMSPGNYQLRWQAGSQSSGIYYYRLSAGKFVQVKRMIVIK